MGKSRISLEELARQQGIQDYASLAAYIYQQLETGQLKPVKSHGTNGKKPALYRDYHVIREEEDVSPLLEEIQYHLSTAMDVSYYLKHPKQYQAERDYALALSRYLDREKDRPSPPVSLNERSFEIWGREKFLGSQEKREGELTGRRLLRHTGVSMEQLNIYETAEPIAYYCRSRQTPQNILLIENKDTFYSMRRHLMSGVGEILGMPVDTLIYGGGKRILKSFRDRSLCIEPYVQDKGNQWYYFGDLDFEGLRIYEQLQEKYPEIPLRPFSAAYEKMLHKGLEEFGLQHLPDTKEGQVRELSGTFMGWFSQELQEQMCQILDCGKYIPQEIINIRDY